MREQEQAVVFKVSFQDGLGLMLRWIWSHYKILINSLKNHLQFGSKAKMNQPRLKVEMDQLTPKVNMGRPKSKV